MTDVRPHSTERRLVTLDDATAARAELRNALESVGHPPRSIARLLTALDGVCVNCVKHGSGARRFHLAVERDGTVVVALQQSGRFTPDGLFPPPQQLQQATSATGLPAVARLLEGLAVGRAADGGETLTFRVPGGKAIWIVKRLQAWAEAHGGLGPRSGDWRRGGSPDWQPGEWPMTSQLDSHFGTFGRALAAAGVTPRPPRGTDQ